MVAVGVSSLLYKLLRTVEEVVVGAQLGVVDKLTQSLGLPDVLQGCAGGTTNRCNFALGLAIFGGGGGRYQTRTPIF